MQDSELVISVGELLGVPKVSLRGCMEEWHDEAVMGVLSAFSEHSAAAVVLDLESLDYAGPSGMAAMIRALRCVPVGVCMHVAAPAHVAAVFRQAQFGHAVRLYSSTNEIASRLSLDEEVLTSRWIAQEHEEHELPFAA
ncbi:MAG: hypothetical protein QHI38_13250 [Armatimonadota bacterium]|nr:hypothetical protein [Armatimonadota bacterium]